MSLHDVGPEVVFLREARQEANGNLEVVGSQAGSPLLRTHAREWLPFRENGLGHSNPSTMVMIRQRKKGKQLPSTGKQRREWWKVRDAPRALNRGISVCLQYN